MLDTFKKRLFFWKKNRALSKAELRSIKQEADYLSTAITSTQGELAPEDLGRLKTLTRTIEDATERLKSD